MALRGHRRRGRHRGRTHQAKHEASLYRRDVLDGMALASDSISAPSERAHRCTLEELEVAQRRMFGGEVGDEVSLCEPMLRVVVSLFGALDYVDP